MGKLPEMKTVEKCRTHPYPSSGPNLRSQLVVVQHRRWPTLYSVVPPQNPFDTDNACHSRWPVMRHWTPAPAIPASPNRRNFVVRTPRTLPTSIATWPAAGAAPFVSRNHRDAVSRPLVAVITSQHSCRSSATRPSFCDLAVIDFRHRGATRLLLRRATPSPNFYDRRLPLRPSLVAASPPPVHLL